METYVKKDKEIFLVRDENIEVESEFRFDSLTHEKVFDEELDDRAIKKAFEIYRKSNDLITPEEIRNLRKMYALSQRAFAIVTGLGKSSIIRYENGAVPTKMNSNFLKDLKSNPQRMEKLFEINKDLLDQKTQDKFLERMSELKEMDSLSEMNQLVSFFNDDSPNDYNGYKLFDYMKVIQVISYFSNRIPFLSKTKLNKLLFYTDFSYFYNHVVSLTGLTYIHDHFGPVPKKSEVLYALLVENGMIEWKPFPNGQGEYVTSFASYEELTVDEIEVLNKVLEKFRDDNAISISAKSHEEKAWTETRIKEKISYEYASELIYKV